MDVVKTVLSKIKDKVYLYSFSALDALFVSSNVPLVYVATTATLIDLAKTFPSLVFPGIEDVDASIEIEDRVILFRTIDSLSDLPASRISPLTLLYDVHRSVFIDRCDVYTSLRKTDIQLVPHFSYPFTWEEIGELAVLISRFHYIVPEQTITFGNPYKPLPVEKQRFFLSQLLTGQNAEQGLRFLHKSGFIAVHWPALHILNMIEHSKEYHPEGNVWEHTLGTLAQRKTCDLVLGLGLLLHDIGKIESERYEGNQFHQHAQIGSFSAVNFLRELDFSAEIIDKVRFLVQYHMLPAAIDTVPLYKTERALSSPLFPVLLELFRCDLASSYRSLTKYYDACKVYKKFLKNKKNPFTERYLTKIQIEPSANYR